MRQDFIQKIYTVEDLDKAYSMGLETAVFVLENSIGMPTESQRALIESIKKMIGQDKISVIRKKIEGNIYQHTSENISDVRASF